MKLSLANLYVGNWAVGEINLQNSESHWPKQKRTFRPGCCSIVVGEASISTCIGLNVVLTYHVILCSTVHVLHIAPLTF